MQKLRKAPNPYHVPGRSSRMHYHTRGSVIQCLVFAFCLLLLLGYCTSLASAQTVEIGQICQVQIIRDSYLSQEPTEDAYLRDTVTQGQLFPVSAATSADGHTWYDLTDESGHHQGWVSDTIAGYNPRVNCGVSLQPDDGNIITTRAEVEVYMSPQIGEPVATANKDTNYVLHSSTLEDGVLWFLISDLASYRQIGYIEADETVVRLGL